MTTIFILLNGWAFFTSIGAKYTTIAISGLQYGMTVFAFIKILTSINRHCFLFLMSAFGTGYY